MTLIDRFPIFVWAGAALLGWVAGEMLISDPWLIGQIGADRAHSLHIPVALVCAIIVVALGYVLRRRLQHSTASGSEVSH
jgi:predicted tellurium resistance membrane protein TerC